MNPDAAIGRPSSRRKNNERSKEYNNETTHTPAFAALRRGRQTLLAAALVGVVAFTSTSTQAADPLASWNDGPAKQAIVEFVKATTTQGSPQFVPPEERIATFDQDGTLWVEHPMYTQVMYCLERVPALVKAKPELANVAPFSTVLELLHGDRAAMEKLTLPDIEKIGIATMTGISVETFQAEAKKWLAEATSALEEGLHRADVSADAGGTEVSPRQRLQDLYRHRRRSGLRPRLRRANVRCSTQQVVGTALGTAYGYAKDGSPSSPRNRSSCSMTTMQASPKASI